MPGTKKEGIQTHTLSEEAAVTGERDFRDTMLRSRATQIRLLE